jgi:hypothetical protein
MLEGPDEPRLWQGDAIRLAAIRPERRPLVDGCPDPRALCGRSFAICPFTERCGQWPFPGETAGTFSQGRAVASSLRTLQQTLRLQKGLGPRAAPFETVIADQVFEKYDAVNPP